MAYRVKVYTYYIHIKILYTIYIYIYIVLPFFIVYCYVSTSFVLNKSRIFVCK